MFYLFFEDWCVGGKSFNVATFSVVSNIYDLEEKPYFDMFGYTIDTIRYKERGLV